MQKRPLVLAIATVLLTLLLPACSDSDDIVNGQTDRFVYNGDGTVTDTSTGLVWLRDADCFGARTWADGTDAVAALRHGQCGLTDNSSAGDWRLPSAWCASGSSCDFTGAAGEFLSIFTPNCGPPYIPDTVGSGCWSDLDPFTNVQGKYYASTECGTDCVWELYPYDGELDMDPPSGLTYIWPVRNLQ